MNIIEQIKADREAGTPGPWVVVDEGSFPGVDSDSFSVVVFGEYWEDAGVRGERDVSIPNARRIARVPEMESIAIAADELAKAGQLLAQSGSVLALAAESTFEGDPALPEAIERFCAARTSHGIALAAFRTLVPENKND